MEKYSSEKENLKKELAALTEELKSIGRKNPDNPNDWEPVPENMDIDTADSNIVADKFEEFEGNISMTSELERKYNDVKEALARIDAGTYGTCIVCGKEIEPARLAANPAAATCEEHMNS